MQRLILCLTLFFIFTACKKQLPKGIISEKEMINLLADVHILDGYISSLPADSAKKIIDPLYNELFLKYKLDSASFGQNVDYYYSDPNLTVKTYDQVIKNLEQKERKYYLDDSVRNAHQQDSINRNMRMQAKTNALKEMIENALADTGKLTIAEYTKRMYNHSAFEHLWDRNILVQPIKSDTIKTVKDSTQQVKNPSKVDSVKDSLSIEKKKTPNTPPLLRSKPVLQPKDRPMKVQ